MDKISVNEFIDVLDDALQRFEGLESNDKSRCRKLLEEQYLLARRIHEFILKADGTPDQELFDEISYKANGDITGWLVSLPFTLQGKGMIDEAIEVGSLFAGVFSPDNFLGDMGVILAESGRRDEALKRLSENLEQFHDDAWVIIKCGDAFHVLNETEYAIELYYRAYALTEPLSYDREGVLERLIPILREKGNDEEADTLIKMEKKAQEERYNNLYANSVSTDKTPVTMNPIPAKSLKVGRNQLCPCGSDMKYKKCCGW